jgi:iron complex transport system substrate-binding protein
MPELLDLAGGQCPLTAAGSHSSYIDWADVRQFDPQVIVVTPCGFDLPRTIREAETLAVLPGWRESAAARAGRVYAADGNAYFNRSGPRLVESLELLAHLVQPELFPPPTLEGPPWRRLNVE